MIRPWIFEFFPELSDGGRSASGATVTEYFGRYLDLWVKDEELDYEGIFFSEHHFGWSFSPSPNLLIAATAARTSKLRLGVMGVVVPYYQPTRIIEEIGMLDHITGGRLEIGTAIGVPQELARVGIGMQEARCLNDEALEILDAALEQDVLSHHGQNYKMDNMRLLPRFAQFPHPPKWTTVVSAESGRKAARRRSKISTGFNPTEQIKAVFDAYRDEAAACGFAVGPEHLGLRRRVVIASSASEAAALKSSVLERLQRFTADDPRVKAAQIPDAPAPRDKGGFELSDDEFIAGTPDVVAQKIIEQCQKIGAGNFLAVLHWGAGFDEVCSAHTTFAREVSPLLRAARV